jgi:hypothetical protein
VLRWLLSTHWGPPGPDGDWPAWLAGLFFGSNLAIALADLSIPAVILLAWKYRREGISRRALWTILVYFPVKAASRLARVAALCLPCYHIVTIAVALLDSLTAALSAHVAYQLGPFLRDVMKLRSREEFHALNNRLHLELLEKQDRNLRLLEEIDNAHRALAADVWLADKHAALDRIAAIVREGR